ncbi:hypothetical protein B0T16DRAFT_133108 [Cercophora newfieldiana]|uniref:Uncharacterized protein n=1 Tax=Cercophora newfieldiana TaxID=92897 RepID=A0AA40CUJ0_9PEZI|nr:hypothetical protein B0T16DRAFT_133108 [Cercophora newfieldiana]
MTRPRYPARAAVWRLVPHGLSVLACVGVIGTCSYAASLGIGYGPALAGRFFAGFWALAVDMMEIVGLADASRRVPRLSPLYLGILELFTAVLVVVLTTTTYALSGYPDDCKDIPITECDHPDLLRKGDRPVGISFVLAIIVAVFHFISSIFAWVDFAASWRGK